MKTFFAVGLPIVLAAVLVQPAVAQFGARSGALGGGFASRGMSRPLGGIAPPLSGSPGFGNRNLRSAPPRRPLYNGYPFGYSVWVPDYFDYVNESNAYSSAYGAPPPAQPAYGPPAPEPSPQQPVIINQYFGAAQTPAQAAADAAAPAQSPADAVANSPNYYLIAYKNHAVYPALAYWVEDKTLHYVTTQNTHNQASLDLIDIDLTRSLNQTRDMPFSVASR